MAKSFENAANDVRLAEVAKKSNDFAKVITLKMIDNDKLVDYPNNRENITSTADLEKSMLENGFTDPLEVTDFGMDDGKYMIVSGHRRRAAGGKVGITVFPCIVKNFEDASAVQNYVLFANAQRDSDNDPLLRARRYKMHEEYLKNSGFTGSMRAEIAERMNLSQQQAARYKAFSKVISPVWDMVQSEVVGLSSVVPMSTYSEIEQNEILKMMNECLAAKTELTRDMCRRIMDGYSNGARRFIDVEHNVSTLRDSGLPLNSFTSTGTGTETSQGSAEHDRNNEIRQEYDALRSNADDMDKDEADWKTQQEKNNTESEDLNSKKEEKEKNKKEPLSEEEEQRQNGIKLMALMDKTLKIFDTIYLFEDAEQAELVVKNMGSAFKVVVDEMYEISKEYDLEKSFNAALKELKEKIKEYE